MTPFVEASVKRMNCVVLSAFMFLACDAGGGSTGDAGDAAPDGDSAAADADGDVGDGPTPDAEDGDTTGPMDAAGDMAETADDTEGPTTGPAELGAYSGGQCPELAGGDMTFTSGAKSRTARIYLPEEPAGAGVLYLWHGLGDNVSNFSAALQAQTLAQTYGWIVVVPSMEPAVGLMPALWGFPSLLGGIPDADLALFDDLAACIDATWDIDRSRIYTLGFSGGALWSSYLVLHRSEVLAGAVSLSGGVSPADQDPPTTFHYETPLRQLPVLLGHGGAGDIYNAVIVVLEFNTMTEIFADALVADGHFTIICRHGMGHYFPSGVGTSALQFLSAHTWENTTSFWQENGLPGSFDASCSIH
jgi:predicted esterase